MSGHTSSTKSLYLIFISTFVFGFITGAVVFFQSNTGNEGDGSLEENTRGFTILATMYGGCMRDDGCPSYRIANNGTYLYIVRSREAGELRYDDTLSEKQLDMLRTNVEETNFEDVANTNFSGTCPDTFDGVAYRYDIQYEGERYTFDSCVENLDQVPLFAIVQNYFEVFSSVHTL